MIVAVPPEDLHGRVPWNTASRRGTVDVDRISSTTNFIRSGISLRMLSILSATLRDPPTLAFVDAKVDLQNTKG
jgi:hypothetical protein